MLERLLDLAFPPGCAACDVDVAPNAAFCPLCAHAVEPAPEGRVRELESVAVGRYGGPLATALLRLKFGDRPDLARPLGGLLASAAALRSPWPSFDRLVPVPLHVRRLRMRGYNQAALLARRIGKTLSVPVEYGVLWRRRETAPQTELDGARRRENVMGAFAVTAPRSLVGQRIALVDDVVTTGATVRACADALFDSGATSVTVLAVATVA